ncbi:hypothetical protein DYB32_000133 [Aphanomyces invadans]|uniref:DUF4460 domain-containing protein n=1 Tax=Aphanomyces invadans TaxID=157072 RepID=A0A3R7D7U9_9STRA|nr:hypothetical protein DYB32_000133 [Aphanomyces invadans]
MLLTNGARTAARSVAARRCFATKTKLINMKPINLKITMATFLLRVHPDVMQVDRHSMKEVDQSIRDHNENALKTLNAYLDVASAGCNGEYTSDMLSTREFPLEFYIPTTKKVQRSQRKIKTATYAEFVHVHGNMYTRIFHPVKLSDKLIETSHQALMNPRTTNVAAVHWRQDTNTVLRDLFFQADIPVLSAHPNGELIPWVHICILRSTCSIFSQDEEVVRQVEAEAIFSSNETFEKKFRSMLVRERDVVFKFTTGYEADVLSDESDDGCQVAFVIGFTHDVDRLVEFLTDEIDKLEVALDAAFAPDPTRRRQKRKGIQPVPKRLY